MCIYLSLSLYIYIYIYTYVFNMPLAELAEQRGHGRYELLQVDGITYIQHYY